MQEDSRMEHGNMLAIVGSPGSGKTTLAVKLAAEIASCNSKEKEKCHCGMQ